MICGVTLDAADSAPPRWLHRLAFGGLAALMLALAGLATALALGAADPPRAGPLLWEQDFKAGAGGWTFRLPPGGALAPRGGALVASFAGDAPDQWAVALAPEALELGSDFTLEVAGAATTPGSPTAYGLVFGWQSPTRYSALLINANGYAEAYRQDGARRETWFTWQQWPHILVGAENNRLRLDVRGQLATLRVNDEIVVEVAGVAAAGQVGVAAATTPAPGPAGEVVFSWARLWGP